ncbi:MAG: nitroreductase family protein [Acidimicrobiia bacterium]|nr:nitroreductase family protein [Acidimicrobiia bacterium]
MDLTEALYTTRAMRRVSTERIPDEAVARILDAAIRAPSGGNNQNWRFLTVTDPALRARLGVLYREAFEHLQQTVYKRSWEHARVTNDEAALRVMRSSAWLAENFEAVPLWVMVFHRNDPTGASIYPAVWNLMLAARGAGIGTCLTTILGMFKQEETFDLLGVPDHKGWTMAAAVSCGYPLGRWGVAARIPVHTNVYAERWGEPVGWTLPEPAWTEPPGYGR